MSTQAIIGIVVGVVLALLVIGLIAWIITARNRFVTLEVKVDEAFSTMDVYLKKRYDMIPNLVECVKGYAKHERETLQSVIEARSATHVDDVSAKLKAEGELTNALSKLMMLSERYPDLKADRQFLDLQNQIRNIEAEIANARKFYNGNVKAFNTSIRLFPANIIANFMKLEKKAFFETDETSRENVKVQF